MPEVIDHQRSEAWLAARRGLITASLAGAVLGLSPYKTRQAAWREIMGCMTEAEARPSLPGSPVAFGTLFESKALLAYEAKTGAWGVTTGFWVSEEYPWLGCSPDLLIGAKGVAEAKCPEFCSRRILPTYRIQCQVQLIVLRREWVDFCQYGWRHEELWIERVPALGPSQEAALIRRLKAFYDRYITGAEEPARKKSKRRKAKPVETESIQ